MRKNSPKRVSKLKGGMGLGEARLEPRPLSHDCQPLLGPISPPSLWSGRGCASFNESVVCFPLLGLG